jgi:hypothetical protein
MAAFVKNPIQRMSNEGLFDDAFQRDPVLSLMAAAWAPSDLPKKFEQLDVDESRRKKEQTDVMFQKIKQDQEQKERTQLASERGQAYSFYPNQDYIKRNLAPEQYGEVDLKALAQAQREAVKAGVLNPEVAKYFLPNVLTEGSARSGNYGLSFPYYSEKGGDPYANIAKKLGLEHKVSGPQGYRYMYKTGPKPEYKTIPPNTTYYLPKKTFTEQGGFYYGQSMTPDERLYNAKLAAMILSTKGKTPEEAIKAWNGIGAGAENHWKKVQALQDALRLPQNADLMKKYNELLQAK